MFQKERLIMRSSQVWNRVQVFSDSGDVKGMPNHFDQQSGEWVWTTSYVTFIITIFGRLVSVYNIKHIMERV